MNQRIQAGRTAAMFSTRKRGGATHPTKCFTLVNDWPEGTVRLEVRGRMRTGQAVGLRRVSRVARRTHGSATPAVQPPP
jgi:hypothetical protein